MIIIALGFVVKQRASKEILNHFSVANIIHFFVSNI